MVARFELQLTGFLNTHLPARLDLFVRLNYEAFFFADESAIEGFLADPLPACGLLTDPVSKRRFRPSPGSEPVAFEGVDFYFESELTRERFRENPAAYFLPGWKMEKKDGTAEEGEEPETPDDEVAPDMAE